MSDFCDAASDLSDYHLALSLRQHANRCNKPAPLPECEFCESATVHVFSSGVRSKYCADCIEELREDGK